MSLPSTQNSIDIFQGEWSSIIPNHNSGGSALLFDDHRISLMEECVGGFTNKNILELGPLEGAHTYLLSKKGAREVTSIEANSRAYLKCLIVKEIFKIKNANFLFGGFESYLERHTKFDFVLASGVIYHCLHPLKVLYDIAQSTNEIGLWSHYYEAEACNKIYKNRFNPKGLDVTFKDFKTKYYTLSYGDALNWNGFCGGPKPTTNWFTKNDWIAFFDFLEFDFHILSESTVHQNGPEFTAVAKKRIK